MAHTPGPIKIRDCTGYKTICANEALIEQLLEACESALEDGEHYRLSEAIKRELRDAIAAARGTDGT